MTNYGAGQWTAPTPRVPAKTARRPDTAFARWSVFLGIQSILMGVIVPIPILAVVFGIVALARGTVFPGRAVTGIVLAATFLPLWAGFIAICVWSYTGTGFDHF
jgi:hypothetical protein